MKKAILAAAIIMSSLVLAPIPGADGVEIIYIGHDFEDGEIGGNIYAGGPSGATVEVVDSYAPWTGESKALHYTKPVPSGTHEIQFEGTAPTEAGYTIESVFMVPVGATIIDGCRVMQTMGMSADFWIMESGDPNTFFLRTWQYDHIDLELTRGVWHELRAENQDLGTWNKYYVNDQWWCESSVGVESPGLYGYRMWLGRDGHNEPLWEVYIDRYVCYSIVEYAGLPEDAALYIGHDFEDGEIGGMHYGSGDDTSTQAVVAVAAIWTGESKSLFYQKEGQATTCAIEFVGDVPDSGFIIETVFMVPAGVDLGATDGCRVMDGLSISGDFWVHNSGDPGSFILRTWQSSGYIDKELPRGVWHKLKANNQTDPDNNPGGWNKYYVNNEWWCESGVGVEPAGYGDRMWLGRDGHPETRWQVFFDYYWCYKPYDGPPLEDYETCTTTKIDNTYTLSWDSQPGEIYQVFWSPVALHPGSKSWQIVPNAIIAEDTVTFWLDLGRFLRLAPTDPSVTKRFYKVGKRPTSTSTFTDYTAYVWGSWTERDSWEAKAAWGDYNKDGYVDLLYYGGYGYSVPGTGLRNNSGINFTAGATGISEAGIWGDYNNDGYLDIFNYVPISGIGMTAKLYENNSGTSFTDVTGASLPAIPIVWSRAACWADLDGDGYLDLYVGAYEGAGYERDVMLKNNGGTTFTIIWQEPLTDGTYFPGRGVTACDFDQDGDQDVYVSNYRLEANYLWRNEGNWAFTEVGVAYGVAGDYDGWRWSYGHTIGSAWGDLDNDGYIDLFVGNFAHADASQDRSKFLKNLGPSGNWHFEDKSGSAGLVYLEGYATPTLGDYDNDGDLDLYLTNAPGYAGNCVLYTNNGDWTFTDVTAAEGLSGIDGTYGAAWADFDNDGDLDLLTDARFFKSNASTNGNHWLKVHLKGDGVTVNSAAIGAQVRIDLGGGKILTRQVEGGTGEGNQNDLTLHFGLGSYSDPVNLEIFWPDGTTEVKSGVAIDGLVTFELGL